MKIKLPGYVQALLLILMLTVLFSLISSCLYYLTWISASVFHIINLLAGYIAYLAGGIWLGAHLTKKAALIILVTGALLLLPTVFGQNGPFPAILSAAGKPLLFCAAAFLIFLKKQKD